MSTRKDFIDTLEACERTSALLLLAVESGLDRASSLALQREKEVELLSSALPSDLTKEDLERLKAILRVGDEVSLRVIAERVAATRSLASLCRGLQIARQLAPAQGARAPGIDCVG